MKYYHNEIETFNTDMVNYFVCVEEKLAKMRSCLENVSSRTGAIKGDAAVAIDAFIDEVHTPILDKFDGIVASFKTLFTAAFNDFIANVDGAPNTTDSEYLGELAGKFKLSNADFIDVDERVAEVCAAYSDIIPAAPDFTALQDAFDGNMAALRKAKKDLEDFNDAHKDDLNDIKEQLASISALCVEHGASKITDGKYNYDITKYTEEADQAEVDALLQRFCLYDAEGNVTGYDWAAIEAVMGKKETLITQSEYLALATIYLELGDADMERFLNLCVKPVGTDGYRPDQHKLGKIGFYAEKLSKKELESWIVLYGLTEEERAARGLTQQEYEHKLDSLYAKYQEHLQRRTVLRVLSGCGEMDENSDGGRLRLRRDGDALTLEYGAGTTVYAYTIQMPATGEDLREQGYEEIAAHFGIGDVSGFAADEARSVSIDVALTMATKGIKGFLADYGPIGFGVVTDVLDESIRQADGQKLMDLLDLLEYGSSLELFGCVVEEKMWITVLDVNGNPIVTEHTSNSVSWYPSGSTHAKIDWLNDHLAVNGAVAGYDGTTNPIDMDDVINNPGAVQQVLDSLSEAAKHRMRNPQG